MQVVITAVGPDNSGLADPIIHYVTNQGANIAEIQMYDHDREALFAMLLRVDYATEDIDELKDAMGQIGDMKNHISRRSVQFFLDWLDERTARVPEKLKDPAKLAEVLKYHHEAKEFWQQLMNQVNAP